MVDDGARPRPGSGRGADPGRRLATVAVVLLTHRPGWVRVGWPRAAGGEVPGRSSHAGGGAAGASCAGSPRHPLGPPGPR